VKEYRVTFRLLNAADYGVSQKRERVFIVGFRSDLKANWSFPESTHTEEALIWRKWVTGEYWDRHGISSTERPEIPAKLRSRLQRTGPSLLGSMTAPWCTVRDAIADLPPPENSNAATSIPNHVYIPGARSYRGHTGSPFDEPAKTLKAGVHGVPGGENMLALPDGQVRYFTVPKKSYKWRTTVTLTTLFNTCSTELKPNCIDLSPLQNILAQISEK